MNKPWGIEQQKGDGKSKRRIDTMEEKKRKKIEERNELKDKR